MRTLTIVIAGAQGLPYTPLTMSDSPPSPTPATESSEIVINVKGYSLQSPFAMGY